MHLVEVALDEAVQRPLPGPAVAADVVRGGLDGLALGPVVVGQLPAQAREAPPLQVDGVGEQRVHGLVGQG
ncbi:MAG: hypothetical protein ACK559_37945, partial [bacterium]